eukprot:UN26752
MKKVAINNFSQDQQNRNEPICKICQRRRAKNKNRKQKMLKNVRNLFKLVNYKLQNKKVLKSVFNVNW